jgi:hypothetical protein
MMVGLGGHVKELIVQTESLDPFHGGTRISPAELAGFYEIDEDVCGDEPPKVIVVFDDMLTTGSHFKAAKAVLNARWPDIPVAGIFLARVVRLPEEDDAGLFTV